MGSPTVLRSSGQRVSFNKYVPSTNVIIYTWYVLFYDFCIIELYKFMTEKNLDNSESK